MSENSTPNNPNNGFGKASLENNFEGFKYFKLKTPDIKKGEESTELIVRLLPSMKSYKDTGDWKFFYGQHYGYYGVNPRDPSKPRPRPFGCIQKKNPKTKEIEVRCPKCDQMDDMRKRLDARLVELKAANPEIDEKSKEWYNLRDNDAKARNLSEWLRKHNCDKKFWVNVMAFDGSFGVLQLSYETTMNVLVPYLKKLRDDRKIDAFDPFRGVFLKFTRTGVRPRVKDTVEVYTTTAMVEGEEVQKTVWSKLDEAQIERALKLCPDLKKDVVTFLPTEKIAALVACNGDPETVDTIWGDVKKAIEPVSASYEEAEQEEEAAAPSPTPELVKAAPAPTKQPKPEAPQPEEDEESKLQAQMAALQAQMDAAKAKATKATKPAKKDTGLGPKIDSPETFLNDFDAAKQ